MYLNFEKLLKRDLTPKDLLFLQAVNQQKVEDLVDVVAMLIVDEKLDKFIEDGIVH